MEILLSLPTEAFVSASAPSSPNPNNFNFGPLTVILLFLFGAFVNACFSFLLEFTFREGQLLHPYRRWLERRFKFSSSPVLAFWYKPLGGCVVCMNIWLSFFSFTVLNLSGDFLSGFVSGFVGLMAFAAVTNFFLRKML